MSKKTANTRIVTFKEEYKLKSGKVVYAKGTTHAIHHKTVDTIKKSGAKVEVQKLADYQEAQKAKAAKAAKADK